MIAVIDAAALLALLLDEPGGELVTAILRGGVMSAVNVSECFVRAVDRGAQASSVSLIVESFEMEIVPFDLTEARRAAEIRPLTRHVGASLGDRACLALAQSRQLPLYTGDRRLAELDLGIDIRLIR